MFHGNKYCIRWGWFYELWDAFHHNKASRPSGIHLPSEERWTSLPNVGNANAISMKIVAKPSEKEQNSGSEKGSLKTTQTTHKKKLKGGWGRKNFPSKTNLFISYFSLKLRDFFNFLYNRSMDAASNCRVSLTLTLLELCEPFNLISQKYFASKKKLDWNRLNREVEGKVNCKILSKYSFALNF